ncbi:AAA family ATPase [Clostridium sp. C8-1-8]|uniref:AAA family ATPase n=1 Tax=Clostridium sp. C8-1-8 TaxID=2698831 RepID=UPI00136BF013|nr:AAA family ATPase [Clostridium sp. C8-1-8]
MKKYLMLIGSPPACGKTFVSTEIAKQLPNPVYLDKDTIIPLSKMVYRAANEPYNRDSAFFKEYVRNAEYEAIMDVAFESLQFNSHVMVNAPFAKEFRDETYISRLKDKLKAYNAELVQVWVHCDIEVCHKRMIDRNSERDTWKLNNWQEYVTGQDFSTPNGEEIHIIDNSGSESVKNDIDKLIRIL